MRLLGLILIAAIGMVLLLRLVKGLARGHDMRLCRHCGEQIPAIGTYCPLCGKKTV